MLATVGGLIQTSTAGWIGALVGAAAGMLLGAAAPQLYLVAKRARASSFCVFATNVFTLTAAAALSSAVCAVAGTTAENVTGDPTLRLCVLCFPQAH